MDTIHLDLDDALPDRNRYKTAKRNGDFTIDQDWGSYSDAEHDRWGRLYGRMERILPGRACQPFLDALETLRLPKTRIPDMAELSARLEPVTGWRVVPVAGLVPDDVFFEHLANRRFPAAAFIRPERELDYLQEPDIFHDIFGHVPLLANSVFAAFMRAYGNAGVRAAKQGALKNLARLYWYTVEFGLVKSADGIRLFGAGLMSSSAESLYALEDAAPHRIRFDLERVMRTDYIIDAFQQSYFVIESFERLQAACAENFAPLYSRLAKLRSLQPSEVLRSDRLVDNDGPEKNL